MLDAPAQCRSGRPILHQIECKSGVAITLSGVASVFAVPSGQSREWISVPPLAG